MQASGLGSVLNTMAKSPSKNSAYAEDFLYTT